MLRRMLPLLTLFAFAGSSPALAYPLNDGSGRAIYPFEAHGTDAFGGVHTLSGSLELGVGLFSFEVLSDGTDAFSGGALMRLLNRTPGTGPDEINEPPQLGLGGVGALPGYIGNPVDYVYWLDIIPTLHLIDVDGVAFDAATPAGSDEWFPPPYAPDISLFEVATLTLDQFGCQDIYLNSGPLLCSQGSGYRFVS